MKTQEKAAAKLVSKRKSHAFGKDIYLLGRINGENHWLEAGKWDCGWYWGFGYVETYTNGAFPDRARDISSHSHVNSLIFKKPEKYDFDKKAFVLGSEYLHHWNELDLEQTTLTDQESWEFSDLMKSFYTLREAAEIYHSGNSHLTSSQKLNLKNADALKRINEVEIPAILARVYEILSPAEGKKP